MIEDNDNRAYTARHVWVLPQKPAARPMWDDRFLTEELQAIVGVDLPMVVTSLTLTRFASICILARGFITCVPR